MIINKDDLVKVYPIDYEIEKIRNEQKYQVNEYLKNKYEKENSNDRS